MGKLPVKNTNNREIDKSAQYIPAGEIRCEITGELYNDSEHERNLRL